MDGSTSRRRALRNARGDYEYSALDIFLHDLAPDSFGERSTGNHTYYGDQTALYGYANDTWRASPKVTINAGLRYEFTAVPVGERAQALNAVASVPGLVDFHAPKPGYTNFAPRFGINYSPDEKTSIRAAFGIAYDVLLTTWVHCLSHRSTPLRRTLIRVPLRRNSRPTSWRKAVFHRVQVPVRWF